MDAEHNDSITKANKLVASSKVASLKSKLETDAYASPEWDMHRDLMASAGCLTNGHSESLTAQSATISLMAAVLTQDRMREPERFKNAFAMLHKSECLFNPLIKHGPDGAIIYPWEGQESADASELNFSLFGNKIASKGRAATVISVILSAIAAIIMIVGGMFYYLNKGDREEWKKEIRSELMSLGEKQANN